MYKITLYFCFLFISASIYAQQIPLNRAVQTRLDELLMNTDTSIFTGFRSMNWLELQQLNSIEKTDITDSAFGLSSSQGNYFFNNLATDNWIKASGNKSVLTIDPYLEATIGKSNRKDNVLTTASAGLRLQSVINNQFSFNADFIVNANQFPHYVDSVIYQKQFIVPGANAATLKGNNRYQYNTFNFNFTYTPNKYFLVSAGYGKQFLGDGYRSLLLSDNAFNYPYVRLQARLWRFTYNVLYNQYENKFWYLVDGRSQRKYSTVHYLGINISKKFQLGLFDNVTWLANDSNMHRGFDVQYINPLIFIRPLEFAIGSPDNAMVGVTMKYNIYKQGYLYGQIALDDINIKATRAAHSQFYGNKYALQLGIFNKDLFNVKGLSWRFEWNGVRPYVYGHGVGRNISLNYTHYYQPLTDPFGANFHEFISYFNYTNKRWYGSLQNLYTIRGENPGVPYNNGEDLWGGEEDVPPYGSKTMQGIHHKYFYNQLSAGYLINPKNRLSIEADIIYRSNKAVNTNQSELYFSFGIKTNIFNFYHDF